MQDYRNQAKKNGVTLLESGPCQFCGAAVTAGVDDCMRLAAELCGKDFSDPEYGKVHQLAVDAHALQHSEIHGRMNNHYHLLSLYVVLKQDMNDMTIRHRLLASALSRDPKWGPLPPPPPLQRGRLTVKDALTAPSAKEHQALVRAWAESVLEAWSIHRLWVERALTDLLSSGSQATSF